MNNKYKLYSIVNFITLLKHEYDAITYIQFPCIYKMSDDGNGGYTDVRWQRSYGYLYLHEHEAATYVLKGYKLKACDLDTHVEGYSKYSRYS